jgi:hypothetical protein
VSSKVTNMICKQANGILNAPSVIPQSVPFSLEPSSSTFSHPILARDRIRYHPGHHVGLEGDPSESDQRLREQISQASAEAASPSHNVPQVCPYSWIDFREQLEALTAVAESDLPVDFEIEYRPFQLISEQCLCGPNKVDRRTFYVTQLSAEKVAAMDKAIGKWVEEKGVEM